MSPIETDVVICGSGSAGLCAAVWLAQAGINFTILESRDGPLKLGQADGVQCRTVEIFDSFNIAEELLRESCHVTELTFWATDQDTGRLVRTSRAPDTPMGISHKPHVTLNQARVNGILLEKMLSFAPDHQVQYDHQVSKVSSGGTGDRPVRVYVKHGNDEKVYHAKYALACDGAHSSVRHSLGIKMEGDSSDAVWGVMDVHPRTNFPDIRRKVTIHSNAGALVIIPREGEQLVRFYIQMPAMTDPKTVRLEELQANAKAILQGFKLEFAGTMWWSAYTIGQRLASTFSSPDGRILLAGDACHTHSPKAGQGMNVSLQDGYNVGWKLAQILNGHLDPSILSTYVTERHQVASDLIDFDRELTKFYHDAEHDPTAAERFKENFIKNARYMAGLTARYRDTILTNAAESSEAIAKNIKVGMRFPSAKVIRHCDAQVLEFQKVLQSDNKWRIVVFSGDIQDSSLFKRLQKVAEFLSTEPGLAQKYTPAEADPGSLIEILLVMSGGRTAFETTDFPDVFLPVTGQYKIRDLSKVFVDDENYSGFHGRAYDSFGIPEDAITIIVVRPDQHVALVISDDKINLLDDFFDRICCKRGA